MKSFTIQHTQLITIAASLTADELARRFKRYTESLAQSGWNGETKLGRDGVGATPEQQKACGGRVARFFGLEAEQLKVESGDCFGDWATRLEGLLNQEMRHFRFAPSTQAGDAEARHNADDIWQDAAAVASLMQGRRRVISLVSGHNLLALVAAVLAPNLLQIDVLDGRNLGPDELSHKLGFGDIVVATPTLWRYLADTITSIPNNVMGLSFGERLTVELAGRLRQRGIGAMRELYGSTETGVVAWRDSAPDPFVLFDHWSKDEGALTRTRSNGQVSRIMSMDDMEWHSPRTFDLGTRRDGAVQIGAINVFPQAIARIIENHPAVSACRVRVSQRSGALDRLIADIKLTELRNPDQAMAWAIDEWCRERLRPAERPRIYSFFPFEAENSF